MARRFTEWKTVSMTAITAGVVLALASAGWAQSTPPSPPSDPAPSGNPPSTTTQSAPPADSPTASQTPGTAPVSGDTQPRKPDGKSKKSDKNKKDANCNDPAPGTSPVNGDVAAAA